MHRRAFLRASGAALVAAPWVQLLAPRAARAQSSAAAKNLLIFFSPNGTIHRRWRPTGDAASFQLVPGSILEPLGEQRAQGRALDHVAILDELDLYTRAGNHEGGMAAMLTGEGGAADPGGGRSVDQVVAEAIGGGTRLPSLELAAQTSAWGGSTQTRMVYAGPGRFVAPEDDPRAVYRRLFGDAAGGDAGAERLRQRRRSVLDLVRGDVADLARRVGAEEKQKLDRHLEALRAVERGLEPPALSGSCEQPGAPEAFNPQANDSFPRVAALQSELAALALACGLTRVVTLQLSHTVSPTTFSWLGVSEQHHSLSHADDGNTAAVNAFVACERWFMERFAELVLRLANTPVAGGGTLLDETVLIYAKELGDGRLHDQRSVPFLVAGGGFRGGRYLKCGQQHHTQLWVSVCRQLGLPIERFGASAARQGVLEGLA